MEFNCSYDGKNDIYKIQYRDIDNVEVVHVGGSAMKEMAKTRQLTIYEENDIGSAIAEYLLSKNIVSTDEQPIFILPEADIGIVSNALPITQDLLYICRKYLEE